ncbi:MAG: ABC transporter ATP-binding protein [Cyanobacteria bacterium J06639_18]
MTYLRLEGITKRFGSFTANDNISFSVGQGKIHAILGENGAGKSTLMNIISGLYQADKGQIYIQEKSVKIRSSSHAIKLGIGMIHQHFMLIPQLTVTENIILGTKSNWRLNIVKRQQEVAALSRSYNLDISSSARVGDLPIGVQQKVEILKVLYRQAKLLILDEPTAVLTPSEVNSFIAILRRLADSGKTIIFISHKLEEVINLCDTVTVLRRGKVVTNTSTTDVNPQQLADLMVGHKVALNLDKPEVSPGEIVLSGKNLYIKDDRGINTVCDISFELREGEILGIAGVDGNGQRELADGICGLRAIEQGKLEFEQNSSILAYIPEDRQKMGLVLDFNICQNLILKAFSNIPFCRRFLLQQQAIRNHAISAFDVYDIRAQNPQIKVKQLSGGNQQKIVLARELNQKPTLIVAMQPTRGLDIGATQAIQQKLLAEKGRGAAILYISTELEEIMAMSDKIAVMYEGSFSKLLDTPTTRVEEISFLMAGGKE